MNDKLSTVIADTGLELEKAQSIWVQFEPFFRSLHECTDKVIGLEITDVSQKKEMAWARKTRLKLKNVRTSAEKTKKQLKAGILKEGRFIDATYNLIAKATRPLEANLKEKEEFAQRKDEERKEALRLERTAILEPLGVDTKYLSLDVMDEADWKDLVHRSREIHERHREQLRIAEEERIAREKADAEERARAQAELERVRQEQAERERKLAQEREEERRRFEAEQAALRREREKAEEAARKEREAREELERQERERQAEELLKAQEEKEAAEREEKWRKEAEQVRLEQASDKEKLTAYLESVLGIEMPSVESSDALVIADSLQNCFSIAATDIERLGQ